MSQCCVTVVIPAYNVGRYIRAAVDSALAQSFNNLEVLVINDGSTDDTLEQLADIRDRRLRIISQPNGGLSAARNAGIAMSRSPYIGFLDGDDMWHPRKLEYHAAVLDSDHTIALTCSYSKVIDEAGRDTGRISYRSAGRISVRDLLLQNVAANGSSVVVRRDAFAAAGTFDSSLRACNDHDMWIRIAALRRRTVWCIPLPLTYYRIRAGQLTKDVDLMSSEWERVLERAARIAPNDVAAVGSASRAHFERYLAYLAYENHDFVRSATMFAAAIGRAPRTILRDRRAWTLAGALLAQSVLPSRLHHALDTSARRLVAFRAHRRIISPSLQ